MLAACSSSLYLPTTADAEKSGVSAEILLSGRKLYISHCGSCHNLYLPEHFPDHHWTREMPEMQRKAKISIQDSETILKYLLAGSQRNK